MKFSSRCFARVRPKAFHNRPHQPCLTETGVGLAPRYRKANSLVALLHTRVIRPFLGPSLISKPLIQRIDEFLTNCINEAGNMYRDKAR
jgi:hypothetical protein